MPVWGGLVVGLLTLTAMLHTQRVVLENHLELIKAFAKDRLDQVADTMAISMNVRLTLTKGLAAFVETRRDFSQEEFDAFATLLHRDLSGIRSLQLAPGGVVKYLSNLEENRAALGHDLLADEKRRPMVEQSIRDRSHIIAGPITLVQGGQAIIARRPLFVRDTPEAEDYFWGFATVLIDTHVLFSEAGLFDLEPNAEVAIRGKDGLGSDGGIFHGTQSTFDEAITVASVALPNASWQLAMAQEVNFEAVGMFSSLWYGVGALLLSILLSGATYSFLNWPDRLQMKVELATENLRATLDSIGDAVITTDGHGNIVQMNPVAEELTGWKLREARGEPVADVFVTLDPPVEPTVDDATVQHTMLVARDKSSRPIGTLAAPIQGREKGNRGRVLVFRDETEEHSMREALKESEEQQRYLLDNTSSAIYVKDADGRYLFVNRMFARLFNCSAGSVQNKRDEDIVPMEVAEIFSKNDMRAIDTGGTIENEARVFIGQEERIFIVVTFPLKRASGDVYAVSGVYTDITDRTRMEEQRFSLERQVQHGQKLESLGLLAGGIAHDFNNILAGVLGYIELAFLELEENHDAWPFLEESKKGVFRATELTQQMLAYSGRGKFVVEAIDLSVVLDEVSNLLRTAISRTIGLDSHLDRSLPLFEGDATQMQQLILNLITNAAESIGDRSGTITLSTGQMTCDPAYLQRSLAYTADSKDAPSAGRYVYVEVRDTGCGMDEGVKEKIFDPFFTTKFTGRGLGMAAVLGIVQGHKGAIMLETQPGVGTTFRLLFPAGNEGRVQPVEVEVPKQGELKGHGWVLVVDDESAVRNVVSAVLKRWGFEVMTAVDGVEGLALYQEHLSKIVCVFLDLTMPRMSGEACLEFLRAANEDVKVIIMSGFKQEDTLSKFGDKGSVEFIQKPFTRAEIREKLLKLL
jgi:PAS domain S-box-containing protein